MAMLMSGAKLLSYLERQGFDFFTGVPCSLIEGLIAALESHPRFRYVSAVREDVAVGVAGGAWLAGRRPVVLMQNSGLGTSLNAIASFSVMYGLPALYIVTWRGYHGSDAPEHILTGEITPGLLDLLRVPFRVLGRDSAEVDVAWAVHEMTARCGPVALVIPPGVLDGARHEQCVQPRSAIAAPPLPASLPLTPSISRLTALRAVLEELDDEPAIHANGYICRESFSVQDRPQNFYMIGSMGLASSIGLGIALNHEARKTVVLDGDGNLLMGLGILPMIGGLQPTRLVHCVFDNQIYGSTGKQASMAATIRLDRFAAAAGYQSAAAVTIPSDAKCVLRAMLASDGPHFLLIKVTDEQGNPPRVPHPPVIIRDRFRATL